MYIVKTFCLGAGRGKSSAPAPISASESPGAKVSHVPKSKAKRGGVKMEPLEKSSETVAKPVRLPRLATVKSEESGLHTAKLVFSHTCQDKLPRVAVVVPSNGFEMFLQPPPRQSLMSMRRAKVLYEISPFFYLNGLFAKYFVVRM